MKISKPFLYQIWLFVLMFAVVWQDFYLATTIGRIGATPLFVLIPIFVLFEIYFLFTKKDWKSLGGDIGMIFITILLLFIISSTVYSIYFGFKGETFIRGENIFLKSIKQSLYYILIILFIRNVHYTLKRIDSIEAVSKLAYYIVFILLIILVGELIELKKEWIWPDKPMAWKNLHSNLHGYYWRVRLLTVESSYTGPIVIFFSIIALIKTKIKSLRFVVILSFIILYLIYTSSKGFLLSFILAIFFTVIIKIKMRYLLIAFISIPIIFFVFIVPYLNHEEMLHYSASLMTRATGMLTGLYALIFNPIGTGGLNYVFLIDYLQDVVNFTNIIFGEYANTVEIDAWIEKGDDKSVSIKSTLGHWALTLGVFGVVLYLYMCNRIIKYNTNNRLMLFGSFFLIFMTLFVLPIEMEYPTILFIIISQYMFKKNKEIEA